MIANKPMDSDRKAATRVFRRVIARQTMTVNGGVRQTAALSGPEMGTLFGPQPDPFGVAHLGLTWRPKDIHFLLELQGQPVAHVGMLRHDVGIGGASVRVAGLGGVITVAHARGQGHASALVLHALGCAREMWSADFALLFCLARLVPFYRRLGFQVVASDVLIDQPAGRVRAPIPVMARSLGGSEWPTAPFALGSLPW